MNTSIPSIAAAFAAGPPTRKNKCRVGCLILALPVNDADIVRGIVRRHSGWSAEKAAEVLSGFRGNPLLADLRDITESSVAAHRYSYCGCYAGTGR